MMRWLALLLIACCGSANALSGVVTRVSDGDTLWVRPSDGKPIKVRIVGIDAPERCQDWGAESTAALASRVLHRQVDIDVRAKDDYQRSVARLTLGGEDIGAWMVLQGHAWSYRYRKSYGPYALQEQQARSAHLGLFGSPYAKEPRVFRHEHGPCE